MRAACDPLILAGVRDGGSGGQAGVAAVPGDEVGWPSSSRCPPRRWRFPEAPVSESVIEGPGSPVVEGLRTGSSSPEGHDKG
jgi:hypothetical protein